MIKALICWLKGHTPMKRRDSMPVAVGVGCVPALRVQVTCADEQDTVSITVCERCHSVYASVQETSEEVRRNLEFNAIRSSGGQ